MQQGVVSSDDAISRIICVVYLDRIKCRVSLLGVNRLMCMTAVERFVTCAIGKWHKM